MPDWTVARESGPRRLLAPSRFERGRLRRPRVMAVEQVIGFFGSVGAILLASACFSMSSCSRTLCCAVCAGPGRKSPDRRVARRHAGALRRLSHRDRIHRRDRRHDRRRTDERRRRDSDRDRYFRERLRQRDRFHPMCPRRQNDRDDTDHRRHRTHATVGSRARNQRGRMRFSRSRVWPHDW
jgi:hypothetical protein